MDATRRSRVVEVESYAYAAGVAPAPPPWLDAMQGGGEEDVSAAENHMAAAELERRIAAEAVKSFEAGRARGLDEGSAAELEKHEERLRRELAGLVQTFAAERERYLREVESEVVKLALGIAARILRREAHMDPLLLTGAVRVALGQLGAVTQVRLRVPAAHRDLWTEAMALLPNMPVLPQVVGDEALRLGECMVETELGAADVGVRAQLREIERGFFDAAPHSTPEESKEPS